MGNTIQILIGVLICSNLFSQNISDAKRLSKMDYMEFANKVNCDSTSGSNIEHKICLNLEFQRLDSIMNDRLDYLLKVIENDSMKNKITEFQISWVENRRNQSELISAGLQGHSLGIYYLDCMVKTTRRRIEEMEYLIEMK